MNEVPYGRLVPRERRDALLEFAIGAREAFMLSKMFRPGVHEKRLDKKTIQLAPLTTIATNRPCTVCREPIAMIEMPSTVMAVVTIGPIGQRLRAGCNTIAPAIAPTPNAASSRP
jgi:hypothetical protein